MTSDDGTAGARRDENTGAGATGSVRFERRGNIGFLTFDRTVARNALTAAMYEQFAGLLSRIEADQDAAGPLRVLVLRGAGGSFVAGTDIAGFTGFRSADDGVRYERRLDDLVGRLEALPVPTLAVVERFAAGAGLLLAAACDLRICTADARFGVPIARTVGNCLSMANTARLLAHFGVARTRMVLLAADFIGAEEAVAAGFVLEIVTAARLDARVTELCDRLASHAPITMAVAKEAIRRMIMSGLPDGEDLIRRAYGSRDFGEGVAAFLAKRPPQWEGE
jgi:enoyl-CoA hydratase